MTPFASSRQRALAADPAGARVEVLRSQGEDIVTYCWGEPAHQPFVVFAHGWSSFGLRVVPWLPLLQELGLAVVSFDQLAHGKSGGKRVSLPGFAQTLSDVAKHFGPAEAVIGHSLGGGATALSLARGLRAKRAILIAPAADGVAAMERFARAYGLRSGLLARAQTQLEGAVGYSMRSIQAYQIAPRIGIPVLIVHDLEDRDVPWSEGEIYARSLSDARLISTTGLGHSKIVTDELTLHAAARFLRGLEVGNRVIGSRELAFELG